jgi:hypothetical protein
MERIKLQRATHGEINFRTKIGRLVFGVSSKSFLGDHHWTDLSLFTWIRLAGKLGVAESANLEQLLSRKPFATCQSVKIRGETMQLIHLFCEWHQRVQSAKGRVKHVTIPNIRAIIRLRSVSRFCDMRQDSMPVIIHPKNPLAAN